MKDVRLDEIDRRLVSLLVEDARMPNNALAAAAGIAPSTCLTRVRALRQRGVIRGFHADVDPEALGRPVQAFISVRLKAESRPLLTGYSARLATLPGVLNVYFLAGAIDFQVHVAAENVSGLRDFVADHLSHSPHVAMTETHLIFEHVPGRVAGSAERPGGVAGRRVP